MEKEKLIALAVSLVALLAALFIVFSSSDSPDRSAPGRTGLKSDPIDLYTVITAAKPGEKVTTGVTFDANGTTVDDNWYKLAEDEEAVYLLYGNYYPNAALADALFSEETGVTKTGVFGIAATERVRLLGFLQDEAVWSDVSRAFAAALPTRTVTAAGSPTREQIESAALTIAPADRTSDTDAEPDLLRPHPGEPSYMECTGYWLATEAEAGCYAMGSAGEEPRVDPVAIANAARPVVRIQKTETTQP